MMNDEMREMCGLGRGLSRRYSYNLVGVEFGSKSDKQQQTSKQSIMVTLS